MNQLKTLKGVLLVVFLVLIRCSGNAAEPRYTMHLEDNWEITGDLPRQAMLISLQGIANLDAPWLYFLYPEKWDFNFSQPLLEYYGDSRHMEFVELHSADEALDSLARYASGYVVWDPAVRTSLLVAFTAAGIEKAIVVTAAQIPIAERYGLKKLEDFRGMFTGKTDAAIYAWAYDRYWKQCSKRFLVYLGGEGGNIMKPGIADFGIYKKAFFTDASTDPGHTEEYAFANKIFGAMEPMSFVFGWHSYTKDLEAQYTALASHYTLRIEGLHTLPNMSFNNQIPLTPGYTFKNNHNVHPGGVYTPKEIVYISCIQTDCLGLGAWTKPGRGSIPYAWEVTMNWSWLAPAMMQYFYDMATPNDYFIGSLSGPGYMYPRSIPLEQLPMVVDTAYALMKTLDLNVFEIMEHSQYWTSGGVDDDVPKDIVDVYYERMPDAIGFANGYRPAHTFASHDGRPFVSYDYYLGEKREENEVVADLQELANLNEKRPYFLLMHVREWSDITRVKSILDQLGPGVELVPLDVCLKLAGEQPTFKTSYGVSSPSPQ